MAARRAMRERGGGEHACEHARGERSRDDLHRFFLLFDAPPRTYAADRGGASQTTKPVTPARADRAGRAGRPARNIVTAMRIDASTISACTSSSDTEGSFSPRPPNWAMLAERKKPGR